MPVMNGYEATKRIRALEDPKLAGITILAMTANALRKIERKHWNVVWMDFYPSQLLLKI